VRQYYANLELEPGASLAEVEAAYRRLMQRYHPDQHQQDPERFRAATELADSLTEAYRALTTHLSR
jgi:curved DNA-binding protein CbpA